MPARLSEYNFDPNILVYFANNSAVVRKLMQSTTFDRELFIFLGGILEIDVSMALELCLS